MRKFFIEFKRYLTMKIEFKRYLTMKRGSLYIGFKF